MNSTKGEKKEEKITRDPFSATHFGAHGVLHPPHSTFCGPFSQFTYELALNSCRRNIKYKTSEINSQHTKSYHRSTTDSILPFKAIEIGILLGSACIIMIFLGLSAAAVTLAPFGS